METERTGYDPLDNFLLGELEPDRIRTYRLSLNHLADRQAAERVGPPLEVVKISQGPTACHIWWKTKQENIFLMVELSCETPSKEGPLADYGLSERSQYVRLGEKIARDIFDA